MSKYKDKSSLGRSDICPFKPKESAKRRHKRRLKTNLNMSEVLNNWAEPLGFEVVRSNKGHQWNNGVHCHDVQLLIKAVEKKWNINLKKRTQRPYNTGKNFSRFTTNCSMLRKSL